MANEKDYLKMNTTLRLDYLKLKFNSKHSQGDIKVRLDKPINDKKIILTDGKGSGVDYIKTRSVFPSVSNIKVLYSRGNSLSNAEAVLNKCKSKEKEFINISKRLKNHNLVGLNIKELIASKLLLTYR
jgi:hypothetical protein